MKTLLLYILLFTGCRAYKDVQGEWVTVEVVKIEKLGERYFVTVEAKGVKWNIEYHNVKTVYVGQTFSALMKK